MKFTNGAKAALVLGTCLICGGVLTAGINNNTQAEVSGASGSAETSVEESEVSVAPILVVSSSEASSRSDPDSAFVPSSGATASKSLTDVSKPVSQPPKPTTPSSSELTDKSKTPSYSSMPSASSKSSTSTVSSAPAGKSYMPGFGYVDGTGGGEMTIDQKTDQDGDINKQVGIMD